MTIAATYAGAVAVIDAISGMSCPTNWPGQVDSLRTPIALCRIDPGRIEILSGGNIHFYDLRILLLVDPMGKGIGIDEPHSTAMTQLQNILDTLNQDRTLGSTIRGGGIIEAIEHDGIITKEWGGKEFWGSEIICHVKENYAAS